MIEPDSQSTTLDLSEVLANRKAKGLSDRIPCLTPYVEPMPPNDEDEASETG